MCSCFFRFCSKRTKTKKKISGKKTKNMKQQQKLFFRPSLKQHRRLFSVARNLFLLCSRSLSLSPSLSLSLYHTHTHTNTYRHTNTLSHPLSFSFSLSLPLSPSPKLCHFLSRNHTINLFLFLLVRVFLSFPLPFLLSLKMSHTF